ncbi:MAG: TetR/AcrR family transcriptional regulator [Gemmataceae bacterium]
MPAGRPRSFDAEQALDRALKVFWRKGYEGASLPELTRAMGINRPSLYAAFGNKEALFRQAVQRYLDGPARHVRTALQETTARQVAEYWLRGSLELITSARQPRGCFLVQGALTCGDAAAPARREMARQRAAGEEALRDRFQRAIDEGDLPRGSDAAALARYLCAVAYGLAVQAASGAERGELEQVVALALQAFPAKI